MNGLIRSPFFIGALSFLMMAFSGEIGVLFRKRQQNLGEGVYQDRDVIVAASLTLLALIIGFSFSMAIGRYDQRKNFEEAEANAIGTEYVRADLLPAADGARVRALLANYLDQRILFYETRDDRRASANRRPYRAIADRAVVRSTGPGRSAADTCDSPCSFRYERRFEFAGIYASLLAEQNPDCCVGVDGSRRYLRQYARRLWRAPRAGGSHPVAGSTVRSENRILSHCGY